MVIALSIVPPKGFNAAGRFWPFSGHLGLTPVSVSGIVRTKLDPDAPSSSTTGGSAMTIALKCYESRLGRVGVIRTNVLYEQQVVLWSAAAVTAGNTVVNGDSTTASTPIAHTSLASISNSASGSMPSPISNSTAAGASTAHTEMIPQGDFPFNIIIPPNSSSSTGFSSCHLQSYRVFWRLEATVHRGSSSSSLSLGSSSTLSKHYDVALIRYDIPSSSHFLSSSTSTSTHTPIPTFTSVPSSSYSPLSWQCPPSTCSSPSTSSSGVPLSPVHNTTHQYHHHHTDDTARRPSQKRRPISYQSPPSSASSSFCSPSSSPSPSPSTSSCPSTPTLATRKMSSPTSPTSTNTIRTYLPPTHSYLHSYKLSLPSNAVGPSETFNVGYSLVCKEGVLPTKVQTSVKRVVELFEEGSSSNVVVGDVVGEGRRGAGRVCIPVSPVSSFGSSTKSDEGMRRAMKAARRPFMGGSGSGGRSGDDDDEETGDSESDVDGGDNRRGRAEDGKGKGKGKEKERFKVSFGSSGSSSASKGKEKEVDNRDKDKDKSGNGKAKMNKQVLFSTTSSVSRVPVAVGGVEDEGREKVVGVGGLRTYEHKAVVQIPEKKSASHWGVGSTMRTGTVCVKFVLSAKITFTSNRGSSEVVKLPEQEFVVASVDEAERQRVIAQVVMKGAGPYGYSHPGACLHTLSTTDFRSSSTLRLVTDMDVDSGGSSSSSAMIGGGFDAAGQSRVHLLASANNSTASLNTGAGSSGGGGGFIGSSASSTSSSTTSLLSGRRRRRSPSPAAVSPPSSATTMTTTTTFLQASSSKFLKAPSPSSFFDRRNSARNNLTRAAGSTPTSSSPSLSPSPSPSPCSCPSPALGPTLGPGPGPGPGSINFRRPFTSPGVVTPQLPPSSFPSPSSAVLEAARKRLSHNLPSSSYKKLVSSPLIPPSAITTTTAPSHSPSPSTPATPITLLPPFSALEAGSAGDSGSGDAGSFQPFAVAIAEAGAGSKSAKLGFEPEQVKEWEKELDKIVVFSRRRSVGIGVGAVGIDVDVDVD